MEKQFNKLYFIFSSFIFLNGWIALAAFAITLATYSDGGLKPDYFFSAGVFTSTLFLYNFQRLQKNKKMGSVNLSERHRWIRNHLLTVKVTIGISFLSSILLLSSLPFKTLMLLTGLALIGFFYVGFGKKGLREIPMLKIFIISISWGTITAYIPLSGENFPDAELFIYVFRRSLFIFILCLLFDVRDLAYDHHSLKTIPQLIGRNGTKYLGTALSVLFLLSGFILADEIPLPEIFTTGFLLILFLSATENRKELFYGFLGDGMIVIYALMLIIFSGS